MTRYGPPDDPFRFRSLMLAEAVRRGADPEVAEAALSDIWQRYKGKPVEIQNVTDLFGELILYLFADRCPECEHCKGQPSPATS